MGGWSGARREVVKERSVELSEEDAPCQGGGCGSWCRRGRGNCGSGRGVESCEDVVVCQVLQCRLSWRKAVKVELPVPPLEPQLRRPHHDWRTGATTTPRLGSGGATTP